MSSTTKLPLKYLFTVWYKDGSSFNQSPEDVSSVDPTRSAYYDVKQDEVSKFILSDSDGANWSVDLETGLFSPPTGVGKAFWKGNDGPKPYKLIFWRQHTHNFNIGLDELSHEVKYILGYSDADGKEHTIYVE